MEIEKFDEYFNSYHGISKLIKKYSYTQICSYVCKLFNVLPNVLEEYAMFNFSQKRINKKYKLVLEELIKNISYYDAVYEYLADDISKEIFTHIIQYRIVPNTDFLDLAANKAKINNFNVKNINDVKNGSIVTKVLEQKENIKEGKEGFSLSISQTLEDIWEVPELIHTINSDYKFYLYIHNKAQCYKTVLYFVLQKKEAVFKFSENKKVVALHYAQGWTNTELTKDCGLIPFLLHKNHKCDSYMVGVNKDDYIYINSYVKGLKMEFLPTGSEIEKLQYILQNGKNIDCLLLRGAYNTNIPIAIAYKKVNPNGKIYVGLDANSGWMDRIIWDEKEFIEFMNCCDVIATSCKAMQKYLNEKWPWKIEYIPNGYYDYEFERLKPDFSKKENTILTVSRLGTPQKATDVLLESFAMIADKIQDWNLKLVGSVNPKFNEYIKLYFEKFPKLAQRVQFVGVIKDKEELAKEYIKAKVFALPSTVEGYPNVISEALIAGCATAVTKFDAWEDSINYGECGMATEINDVKGFANVLLNLCKSNKLEQFSDNAYQYALRNYDMEKVVAKLYEMLFGGE